VGNLTARGALKLKEPIETADKLATLIHRVAADKERVVVTGETGETAALVPIEDLKLLEEIEEIEDRIDLEDALEALKEPSSIPWEQVKQDLGL
jgi:prevent-host-death family protein